MADDGWIDVAQPKAADDGWVNVGSQQQPAAPDQPINPIDEGYWSSAGRDMVNSTSTGGIMAAFGQGFREASGPEPLGMSPENVKALSRLGIFAPEGQKQFQNPFQAFNEGIILPAAALLDGAVRTFNGTYRGLQAAGVEAGLPRDVVSLPDAFAGSPGALGEIKMRSGLPHDRPVGRAEPSPQIIDTPAGPITAPPGITAYHGSPHDFEAFSTQHIGTGEGAQSFGHGLYFAESQGVAKSYAETLSAKQQSMQFRALSPEENAALRGRFPPNMWGGASGDAIQSAAKNYLENTTQRLRQYREELNSAAGDKETIADLNERIPKLEKEQAALRKVIDAENLTYDMPNGNLYGVRIKANPDHFLDWDKPLNQQSGVVIDGLAEAAAKASGKSVEEMRDFMRQSMTPAGEWFDAAGGKGGSHGFVWSSPEEAASDLTAAGVKGVKYLDHDSRTAGEGSRNFVIFNEGDIQITHKNGEPIVTPEMRMAQAKDMGIIGPERQPISDGTPAEAAQRTVSANANPGEKVTQEVGSEPNPWRERFDQFVGKITTGDDVKQLITDAADQNGEFPAARAGDIPLKQFGDITEAAGVDPASVDRSGVGRLLRNDNMVRNAMQGMLSATEQVRDAAREVKADPSEANLMKLQEAMLRRDTWVEQVVGHRAEWGRTGNVFQEFLKRSKEEGGFTQFLKDQDRSPEGLKKLADAIDNLDPAQAAKLLSDANKPTFWDKFKFYWVNALISGPVTHAKYIVANGVFGAYESAVVTPVAGVVGSIRRAFSRLTPAAEAEGYRVAFRLPDGTIEGGKKGEIHVDLADRRGLDIFADVQSGQHLEDGFVDSKGNFFDRQQMAEKMLPESGEELRDLRPKNDGVYIGEAAAKTWGLIAGVPDALKAAVEAGRTGLQTALPGELAQGIVPKRNQNVAYQQRPIPGTLGAVIGVPSKGASAIHSFFNFLGYRASIEAQAYRAAAKEGLSVTDDAFWQRREGMAARPTEEMMNSAIEDGYRLTYISELGDTGKKLSAFVNSTKVGQLIMPFTHIPLNILKRAVEGTPAAWLDTETRDAMMGKAGAAKQDMAIARMVTGGAVGAWAVNQVLNERMTGFGPTDPKERAEWMAAGHQPYSIRIGDEWLSFNRFGSLGTMLGLYANLAEVIPHMKPDAEELTKAIGMTVHSTGRLMEDEVGMQGLSNLMQAIDQPDRSGSRYVANFTGSLLPYSSLLRQVASSMDPSMREAKTVVDGLRYYIPVARQGLLPKRDWSGTPIANAGYGGDLPVPGASSIIQHRSAIADPVALEFAALDIKPAPPQDRIKGVKLPPQLYDIYQSTAGPFTRTALEHYVNTPGWHDLPIGVRADIFRSTIRATREAAGAAMQMRYPQLIQQGMEDRGNRINGGKPGKLQDVSAP